MRLAFPSWLTTFREGLVDLFYPNTCWVCNQLIPECKQSVCPPCLKALTSDPGPACPRCASTVGPFVDLADGCAKCRSEKYVFDGAFRMGPYDGLLRDMVLHSKTAERKPWPKSSDAFGPINWHRACKRLIRKWSCRCRCTGPVAIGSVASTKAKSWPAVWGGG